ncbi:retrovirus-related pol polyprotein from transposon TNT 1-94 [Tanacetum coccineum]
MTSSTYAKKRLRVEAQDVNAVVIFVVTRITSLMIVLSPKETRHLSEELRVIAKMGMNLKMTQHVLWPSTLKRTSPLVDDDMIKEHVVQNHDRTQNLNCDLEEILPMNQRTLRNPLRMKVGQWLSEELDQFEVTMLVSCSYPLGTLGVQSFLIDNEYKIGIVNNTIFTKIKDSHLIIIQIYIDDIIFGSTCQSLCDEFSKLMHDEFEMSMMCELSFFLGLQIKQMNDGIFFNQSKYIGEMLKKFGLENSKVTKTPMSRKRVLTLYKDSESIDSTKYRGMIGSLLYLTASRSNIMFSVCFCARFQEDPKVSHLEAVKRIFRYIKGTQHLGLWYLKDTGVNVLVYANSDHAGDVVDRKSTSGICTFMGSCLTSWFLKKQTSLANSITESDYVAAERACQQGLWMKQAFMDYNITLNEVPILHDDKCAINLTSSPIDYPRTKHEQNESREMLLSIHYSLKMLLDIISKMNRKLEDGKIKRNDKGKEKVNGI